MINFKGLENMGTVNFRDGSGITLDNIMAAIKDLAEQQQVPVAFYNDEAKEGLFGSATPCLVMYHPEHRYDYYNMAMIVSRQGNYASVNAYAAGKSKQMSKFARSEANKEWRRGRSMSEKIGNAAVSGLMNLGKSKAKLQEEQLYYEICLDLIGSALNE